MRISATQSDFLNSARWFSAWLVVAEHARSLMFVDYSQVESHTVISKAFYFITGFGHEAVMVFFVISGYLVGGKVISRMRNQTFRWRNYLADRFSRLYAVLILALLIGFVFDTIGSKYINQFGLYDQSFEGSIAVIGRSFNDSLDIPTFFGNLFFLQTIFTQTFGSNGPLWSLANEFWYYVLFPALLGFWCRSKWLRIVSLVTAVCLLVFLPVMLKILFGVWVIGALMALIPIKLLPVWISSLATVFSLFLARIEIVSFPFVDKYLIGISFSLLVNSLLCYEQRLPFAKNQERLAEFSFSTYLMHFPLLVIGLSALHQYFDSGLRMPFSLLAIGLWLVVNFGVLLFCWLFAQFTEARTASVRKFTYRIMGLNRE